MEPLEYHRKIEKSIVAVAALSDTLLSPERVYNMKKYGLGLCNGQISRVLVNI
jgi:hypothetical protein